MRRVSPHVAFLICVAGYLASCAVVTRIAVSVPWTGVVLAVRDPGARVVVRSADPDRVALVPGAEVREVRGGGARVPLSADLFDADPDGYADLDALHALVTRLDQVRSALQAADARLVLADGREVPVQAQRRAPLAALPAVFWIPLVLAAVSFLFASTVWAFRPERTSNRYFALSGALLLVVMIAAAVYRTRLLGTSGAVFDRLVIVRHAGSFFLAAALVNLCWNYPRRLRGWRTVRAVSGVAAASAALLEVLRVQDSTALVLWLPLLVGCGAVIGACAMQIWTSRDQADVHARSLWFGGMFLAGAVAFCMGSVLPALLGRAPPLPRMLSDGLLVLIYAGISFGIYRRGLLDVDRWVFGAWIIFFASIVMLAADAGIAFALSRNHERTLLGFLALMAWGYFPLRQALWMRLARRMERRDFRQLAPYVFEKILSDHPASTNNDGWVAILRRIFAPLRVTPAQLPRSEAKVARGGTEMWLPALAGSPALTLAFADRGNRLFTEEDRKLAVLLCTLVDHLSRFREAVQAGAHEERRRIARDLHDEVVPPLLSAIYGAPDTFTAEGVRTLVRDLRLLLRELDGPLPVAVVGEAEPASV